MSSGRLSVLLSLLLVVFLAVFQLIRSSRSDLLPQGGETVPAKAEKKETETDASLRPDLNRTSGMTTSVSSFLAENFPHFNHVIAGDIDTSEGAKPFCQNLVSAYNNMVLNELPTRPSDSVLFNVSVDCSLFLSNRPQKGTGNVLFAIYTLRQAARSVGQTHVLLQCPELQVTPQSDEAPLPFWAMGWIPALGVSSRPFPLPSQACQSWVGTPFASMIPDIRQDLRRMAVSVLGLPQPDSPIRLKVGTFLHRLEQEERKGSYAGIRYLVPLPPVINVTKVELDDAVVHFRCGDILVRPLGLYGHYHFSLQARHISPEARSIGIVTLPFNVEHHRKQDASDKANERCQVLVTSLVEYLTIHFPETRITVRNDPEPLPVVFSRLVLANQTLMASFSTFSLLAVMATFGTGYVPTPTNPRFQWIADLGGQNSRYVNSENEIVVLQEPLLSTGRLWKSKGQDAVLEWLWQDEQNSLSLPAS